jgi:hypothetical protein
MPAKSRRSESGIKTEQRKELLQNTGCFPKCGPKNNKKGIQKAGIAMASRQECGR